MSLSLHLLERELVSLPPPKMTSKSYMTQYHYALVDFYIFGISVGFHHVLFLMFKLSHVRPVGALAGWFLCL